MINPRVWRNLQLLQIECVCIGVRLPVDSPTNQIATDHIATNYTNLPLSRFTHLT